MMHRIEYLLKHNKFIQGTYVFLFSLLFKFLGIFVRPNKKRIIFQSLIGKNYGDSIKVLYDSIRNNPEFEGYQYVWAFDEPDKFEVDGAKKVKLNSINYYMEALKCGIWICNVSIERGLRFKPKKTIYINTWHGVPMKLIGNAQKNRDDYDFSDIDFMCCSCEFEREVFVRDFKVKPENMVKCGMPRNDELYNVTDEKVKELRRKFNIPEDKKVILYAPTWRDSADGGKSYQIAPPIDVQKWEEKLGNEYVMLFRMHHLTTAMLGIEYNDFARDCSHVPSINELMIIADVLLSDYSATIFDFSILEKPMISFAYDYEGYAESRGFYENINDVLLGCVFDTEDKIIKHILDMDYEAECLKTKDVKNKYMEADGNATKVCMDYLLQYKN